MMIFWAVVGAVLVAVLVGAWLVDRDAARRGYRVQPGRRGVRRQYRYERLDPDDHSTQRRGRARGQNFGGSR